MGTMITLVYNLITLSASFPNCFIIGPGNETRNSVSLIPKLFHEWSWE